MPKLLEVRTARGFLTSIGWCLYQAEERFRFIALQVSDLGPLEALRWHLAYNEPDYIWGTG